MEKAETFYRVEPLTARFIQNRAPSAGPLLLEGCAFRQPGGLPTPLSERLLPSVYRCCGLGFQAPSFVVRDNPLAPFPEGSAVLRHGSGNAAVRIQCEGRGEISFSFLTRLRGGGTVISSNRALMGLANAPKEWTWGCDLHEFTLEGAGSASLWDHHKRQLALLKNAIPEPFVDDEQMIAFCDATEKSLFEKRVSRGLLKALSPREVTEAQAVAQAEREYAARVENAKAAGEEVESILRRLTTASNALPDARCLWAFLLTAVMMIVAGLAQPLDLRFWGMTAGGFLLHELGWFVAGKLPRHPLTAATLMGALPGLLAGTALAAWAALGGEAPGWAGQMGLILLVPNLLTLLPFSFLNGGRFLESVLFCRNPWLKPASRLLAGALVAGIGWLWQSPALSLLGIWTALLPIFESRETALGIRLRTVIPPGNEEPAMTPETVAAVVRAVKLEHRRLRDPHQIEEIAYRVYTAMQARPPGRWTTSGLLALYGCAFLLPVVPMVLYVEHNPTLTEWASVNNREAPAPVAEMVHPVEWVGKETNQENAPR